MFDNKATIFTGNKLIVMSKSLKNYNCTQQELYSVAEIGWVNYATNNADFTLLKGKYTPKYGTDSLADVLAAKALPAKQTRDAVPENVRVQLIPLWTTCLANQRKLKSYLEEIFVGDATKSMLTAAGFGYYLNASNQVWEDVHSMIALGLTFITDHSNALEAGTTNMPAGFVATYTSGKTAFETVYNNYIQKTIATFGGTNVKIVANNSIYTKLNKMLSDGRLIFEDNDILKSEFTFTNLLAQVAGTGTTGMRITVKDSITKLNITNYKVTVQPGDMTRNADGNKVLILQMSADKYWVEIITPGYPPYTNKEVVLTTGVIHKVDLVLEKNVVVE